MKEITIYVPTDPKVELPEEREKFYNTSRGYLFFNQLGYFCDDDLFPIESIDKIKFWLKPVTISEEYLAKICYDNFGNGPNGVAKAILALMKGEK